MVQLTAARMSIPAARASPLRIARLLLRPGALDREARDKQGDSRGGEQSRLLEQRRLQGIVVVREGGDHRDDAKARERPVAVRVAEDEDRRRRRDAPVSYTHLRAHET